MEVKFVLMLLLTLVSLSLALEGTREEVIDADFKAELRDIDAFGEISRRVIQKFSRSCGIHGWKKCVRRRSSSYFKVIRISNVLLEVVFFV